MRVVMFVLALLYLAKAPRSVRARPQGRRGVWNWTPLPVRYQMEIAATTLLAMMAIVGFWTFSRTYFPSDPTKMTLGLNAQWMFLGAMFMLYNAVAFKTFLAFQAIRAKAETRCLMQIRGNWRIVCQPL